MRTLISIAIFTCMPIYALCQIQNYGVTLIINEGSTIYNKGDYNNKSSDGADGALDMDGKMVVIGDWINNAANNALINVDAVGTITMAGTSMQTISGAKATTFETLEINNSTGGAAVKLDTNINVYDSLIITDGNIDLNSNNIDLGNLGLLSGENNGNRIYGTAGEIIASRILSASITYTNIAGLAIDIITDAIAPGATQIKRSHADMELNVSTNRSILRDFEITPTVNNSLNATLRINYFDNEINSLNENDFIFYKSPTGANPWAERTNSVVSISDNYVEETGINDFSKWTIGQKGVGLPIELLSFSGYNAGDKNILEWSTATEINNDYFTVERSLSFGELVPTIREGWGEVGIVKGAGNSSSIRNYEFTDPLPPLGGEGWGGAFSPLSFGEGSGVRYYRLKQTDFDGQYSYSNIIAIKTKESAQTISIFPNPAADGQINVLVSGDEHSEICIEIIDIMGRTIISQTKSLQKGTNKIKVDVSWLNSGIYYLCLSTESGLSHGEKIMVIK